MKYLFLLAALMVAPLLAATPAAAQVQAPFNESAAATSFAPTGNVVGAMVSESATWDGTVSGMPLSGYIHVQENRTHAIDAASGPMRAQFTMSDGAGSTIMGSLSGQFAVDANGSSAAGSYAISGGTGAFAGVSGSGSFSQSVSNGGVPTLNLSGVLAGPAYPYAPVAQYYDPGSMYAPAPTYYDPSTMYAPSPVYVPDSSYVPPPNTGPQGNAVITNITPGYTTTVQMDTGTTVIWPNQQSQNPARNSPAITGAPSGQGCNVSGEGRSYSATGQSC